MPSWRSSRSHIPAFPTKQSWRLTSSVALVTSTRERCALRLPFTAEVVLMNITEPERNAVDQAIRTSFEDALTNDVNADIKWVFQVNFQSALKEMRATQTINEKFANALSRQAPAIFDKLA